MKVYVTARFKGADNKHQIEALCKAVHDAKLRDFCLVRDVEHYEHTFDSSQELWTRAFDEIGACDALLVDVSDNPSGGRLVEAGMAYALRKTVIVVKRPGVAHKSLYDGIASVVITYEDHKDLTRQLKQFDDNRNFNVTDKVTMLVMFLMLGGIVSVLLANIFIPLSLIWMVGYWLVVRRFFESMRVFDRVVVYIPLIAIWVGGYVVFDSVYNPLAVAWLIGFWFVALFGLRKIKFSL